MMKRIPAYLLLCVLAFGSLLVAGAWAQTPNRAGLVVRFDDQRVETRCVSFTESEISGYELLERSGLAVEVDNASLGTTVCRVEEVGCSADNCWCQCQGASCIYWSYWHLGDGDWRYSGVGAHASVVSDGDVEGWSWGPGAVNDAVPPPLVDFDEICAAPATAAPATAAPVIGAPAIGTPAIGTPATAATAMAAVSTSVTLDQELAVTAVSSSEQESADGSDERWTYLVFGFIVVFLIVAMVVARGRRA